MSLLNYNWSQVKVDLDRQWERMKVGKFVNEVEILFRI